MPLDSLMEIIRSHYISTGADKDRKISTNMDGVVGGFCCESVSPLQVSLLIVISCMCPRSIREESMER